MRLLWKQQKQNIKMSTVNTNTVFNNGQRSETPLNMVAHLSISQLFEVKIIRAIMLINVKCKNITTCQQ